MLVDNKATVRQVTVIKGQGGILREHIPTSVTNSTVPRGMVVVERGNGKANSPVIAKISLNEDSINP